jgi:hypothetical protein
MSFAVLMAQSESGGLFSDWMKPSSAAGQVTIMIGAVLVVGLVIFMWAAIFRKPRHRKHSHHHSPDLDGGGLPERHKRSSTLARMLGKKRHKRRRSRERPANPTLAQIGGLPPRRDDHPPS